MLSHSILVWVFNFSLWVFLNGKLCLIGVFLAFICVVVAMEVLLVRLVTGIWLWLVGADVLWSVKFEFGRKDRRGELCAPVVADEAVIRHTWVELELKQIHGVGIYGWGSVCETIDGELLEYSHTIRNYVVIDLYIQRAFYMYMCLLACGSLSDGLVKTSSALVGTLLKTYQRSGGAGSALASAVCAAPAAAVA
ncbi:hypothetical protein C5167_043181 [Papaver somniferum]|uniref:Autophagy-related protein 2 n=1 Tax=Papaver somniferum TaxID=3469 RepID=A0A4Y7L827_PAPSO|nr:hypothetical protein C5167_043181 [Papaver somniferum]